MRQCTHRSRRGIVTNIPPGDPLSFPHASRSVCHRDTCIAAAISWVAGQTNQSAHFYPDDI